MAYTEVMQKRIYMDKERLRAAYTQFAQQLEPELFLTLATNQQMSIGRMQNLTRRFLRSMDQWKHGKRSFMHVDAEQRIRLAAVMLFSALGAVVRNGRRITTGAGHIQPWRI